MTDPKTIPLPLKKTIHAKSPLTPADIVRHAEAIIRFDREAALRTQQGVTDLVQPSHDQSHSNLSPLSSLDDLCGVKSALKIKPVNDTTPKNIVTFAPKKKD